MAVPLTVVEQNQFNYFRPAQKIGLYVGMSDYSNVAW